MTAMIDAARHTLCCLCQRLTCWSRKRDSPYWVSSRFPSSSLVGKLAPVGRPTLLVTSLHIDSASLEHHRSESELLPPHSKCRIYSRSSNNTRHGMAG